jgi:small subunit ribosomal protein MRP21
MEVRRVADTLMRCQPSSLAGLLVPPSTLRWPAGRQLTFPKALPLSRRQTFITTTPRCAFKPTTTTSATPSRSQNEKAKNKPEDEGPARTDINKAAQDLGWLQGGGSRSGGSRQTQEHSRLSRERELSMNSGNSADDILKSMNSTFSSPSSPSTGGIDLSRMMSPSSQNRPESATDMMSAITTLLPKKEKIPIRLSSSTGRSIAIHGHVDVARGFKLMERTCASNSVRRDSMDQRYHERRGMKKKRLRGLRWRRRFMEGFRATIAKVVKYRKQGW